VGTKKWQTVTAEPSLLDENEINEELTTINVQFLSSDSSPHSLISLQRTDNGKHSPLLQANSDGGHYKDIEHESAHF